MTPSPRGLAASFLPSSRFGVAWAEHLQRWTVEKLCTKSCRDITNNEYGQAKKQAVVWGLNQRKRSQGCDLSREGEEQSQVKAESRGQQSWEHSQVWVKVKLPGL